VRNLDLVSGPCAAKHIGISASTWYRWQTADDFPFSHVRVGDRKLFYKKEIVDYINGEKEMTHKAFPHLKTKE